MAIQPPELTHKPPSPAALGTPTPKPPNHHPPPPAPGLSARPAPGSKPALYSEQQRQQHQQEDRNSQARETEADIQASGPSRIWNHLTISQDQTSASEFAKDRLSSILSRAWNSISTNEGGNPLIPILEPEILDHFSRDQIPNQSRGLGSDQVGNIQEVSRQRHQHQQMIDRRNVYLHHLRQDMLSGGEKKASMSSNQDLVKTQATETNMSQTIKGPQEDLGAKQFDSAVPADVSQASEDAGLAQHHVTQAGTEGDLLSRIASLERENKTLKKGHSDKLRYETLYFIMKDGSLPIHAAQMAYVDEPTWFISPTGDATLRSVFPINDVNGFLRQRPEIAFVVAHYYNPRNQEAEVQRAARANQILPRPEPASEHISIHSKDLTHSIERFLALQPTFAEDFPDLNVRAAIPAPYLFWYRYRSRMVLDGLSETYRKTLGLLTSWIEEKYAGTYDRVDDQFRRGVVSQETMPFLVKPGDVLVWEEKRKVYAAVSRDWLRQSSAPTASRAIKDKERDWTNAGQSASKFSTKWCVDGWDIGFDGEFYRRKTTVGLVLDCEQDDEEVEIADLKARPLQYAPPRFKAYLEKRGRSFWRCRVDRNRQLVAYEGRGSEYGDGDRFMIDFQTYRQIHSNSISSSSFNEGDDKRLGSEFMELDTPPTAPDIYVFPTIIPGYNLRNKKWIDLDIDLISQVIWNKKSFDHLVVDDETKELVQALVKHQIASEQSTDIIDRKGNGLIILLHGGPGTGKTFTAESVAEMAEKPLFRVTCGDIGTKPEQVEKYLDSVLHLGKTWDCIVLIDEAEVFLEQRSLDNLERNALVSVFLRVLEYYEGILILTSNRVGTFDEAFKSRILLSLHYENLTEGQRTQIWKNFLRRLEDMGNDDARGTITSTEAPEQLPPGSRKRKIRDGDPYVTGIDFDEIESYITELAKKDLNGRQIRNVITAARQLAKSRQTPMQSTHLKHVIEVSSKFDKYLKKLQEGYSDDQIARDEGFR
ncbi:hypothetical protein PG999_006727 [Apiospora kogelbergensis]|uniref:AAA+ ATPase domain-containing protein n=1 Tax=Apiospora kogelbergensis TaxID=1337665 RepID=A0AAW0QWB2_9PEZI